MNDIIITDNVLDVTGLSCPKPLLYTKKKLATLAPATILKILLDDKKSLEDFSFFCQATGHILLKIEDTHTPIIVYIQTKTI
jgi:tRNA 2-thiouridine synthesizing protein A